MDTCRGVIRPLPSERQGRHPRSHTHFSSENYTSSTDAQPGGESVTYVARCCSYASISYLARAFPLNRHGGYTDESCIQLKTRNSHHNALPSRTSRPSTPSVCRLCYCRAARWSGCCCCHRWGRISRELSRPHHYRALRSARLAVVRHPAGGRVTADA